MTKRPSRVDPVQIFLHADGFYKVGGALDALDWKQNPQIMTDMGHARIVLSALNSELFLKCLICIETDKVAHGHHLRTLFKQLRPKTRNRITHLWNTEVVPLRNEMWTKIENSIIDGHKIDRDLLAALAGGSEAFEKIRYSYEGNHRNVRFYLSDLPWVLRTVILEMRPEWRAARKPFQEISPDRPVPALSGRPPAQ
jgi:hypothetical protein